MHGNPIRKEAFLAGRETLALDMILDNLFSRENA
jgi:hypothetical protein